MERRLVKIRRQLPRTPSVDASDIVSGVPNVTVEMRESSRIATRKKSSRCDNCRHSWIPTQSHMADRAEQKQLSTTDDLCAQSSCNGQNSSTARSGKPNETTPNSKTFLTVDQGFPAVNPIRSGSALQRRIQYLQCKQRSVGQRESQTTADNCDYLFSASFDCGCASLATSAVAPPVSSPISTPIGQSPIRRLRPQRADSTTSDDSLPENGVDKRGRVRNASSSTSLHMIARRVNTTESQKLPRGMRSSSAVASKNTIRNTSERTPTKGSTANKPPSISYSSQAIIVSCMENARSDIATRIIQRMAHRRDDFAQFCANLSAEQTADMVNSLKQLLIDVVKHITSAEKIREISIQFGIDQVPKRGWGFKADFFAVMANALATECVFLDGAAHQPTETIEAWAELVELMFSNVRDGYYQQIRYLRRNSHCFNSMFSCSSDRSTDGSDPHVNCGRHHDTVAPHHKSTGQLNETSVEQPVAAPGVIIRF
uniref:Uncharacterized protein n=1 Tax=Parascaris univalens TaxID=6257 RepID=A0A915AXL0_PARUN